MSTATAENPQQEEATEPLGPTTLFLPDDYTVHKLGAVLGGINIDIGPEHPLYGLVEGDEFDAVIRGVVVTGTKTHKGEVTLILTGEDIDVLKPRGLPSTEPQED